MKVSIITICFNSEKTIRHTIDSVLNQDYKDIEYILIDGKSTDKTLEIISSYGDKIQKVISEKDNGIYDAMNKGLAAATGDVIGFINSDDELFETNTIDAIVQKFAQSNADVVYGDKLYVDPEKPTKEVRFWKSGEFNRENYKKGWMTPHLSTYIKKEQYEKCGIFRTDMKIAADYEIMFRIIYVNMANTVYLPKTIAKMRAGGISNSSFKNIMISNLEVYKSWKVNNVKISPFIIIRKPLKKIFQLFKTQSS